ncbi:MAG: biotin/lipoyl-containing protein [Bacteroidota bacterium]
MQIIIGDKSFDINPLGKEVDIDGIKHHLDLVSTGTNRYHLLINHKSYNLEIVSYDVKSGEATIKVNNQPVRVLVKTELDKLLSRMGLNHNNVSVAKEVGAPMPGLILDIVVKEGDEVKKGDKLLILEAMKMENIIKAPGKGKISSIIVNKGDSVDTGQKLIHFE